MSEQTMKGVPVKGARCGTTSGHARHLRLDEEPCNACARAKAEYDVRWRNARTDGVKRNRAHAKAQQRALLELRRAHVDEYAALYAAHKATVFDELGLSTQPSEPA